MIFGQNVLANLGSHSPKFSTTLCAKLRQVALEFASTNPGVARLAKILVPLDRYPKYKIATKTSLVLTIAFYVLSTWLGSKLTRVASRENRDGTGPIRDSRLLVSNLLSGAAPLEGAGNGIAGTWGRALWT